MYETTGLTNTQDMIDLRSDTVTRPTPQMREAMMNALVGDDQYGEDPTVNRLEEMSARMLGKEAAVFVASGTMGNLTALLAHCKRGDEIILGSESHILWYESAGPAAVGGLSPRTVQNMSDGTFDLDEVADTIRVDGPGYPPTGLICVENTHNRCGGAVLSLEFMRNLRELAASRGIPIHLDGARIFNAAASLGVSPAAIAAEVDSVQFCFSKGLGAPVGSMVAGDADFIQKVRKQRKLVGGAMRQAGVIAAAAVVSLETMVDRLPEDQQRAKRLAEGLARIPSITIDPETVQSNIVVFRPDAPLSQNELSAALRNEGILSSDFGRRGLRMVTHYEITDAQIDRTLEVIAGVVEKTLSSQAAHV